MEKTVIRLISLFGVLLCLTGLANFSLLRLDDRIREAWALNRVLVDGLTAISIKFEYLQSSIDEISASGASSILQAISEESRHILETDSQVSVLLMHRSLAKLDLFSEELVSDLGLFDAEYQALNWLIQSALEPQNFNDFAAVDTVHPQEVATLSAKNWNARGERVDRELYQLSRVSMRARTIVMVATFFGLALTLFLIVSRGVVPQVRRSAALATQVEQNLRFQTALSGFSSSFMALDLSLVETKETMKCFIDREISRRPELRDISIALTRGTEKRSDRYSWPLRFSENQDWLLSFDPAPFDQRRAVQIADYLAAICKHITSLTGAQLRIKAETQRDSYYQAMVNTLEEIPYVAVLINRSNNVEMVNQSFRSFFSEGVGGNVPLTVEALDQLHSSLSEEANFRALLSEETEQMRVCRYPNKRILMWSRFRLADVGFVLMGQDVTDYLDSAAAKEQARKLEAIGQVASTVAHDSNNFLAVIMNALELLSSSQTATLKEQKIIDGAVESVANISSMNRQLLSYSRRQVLLPCRVTFKTLVHAVKNSLTSIDRSDIVVECSSLDCDDFFVDKVGIERAILNIFMNSVEAMPNGGTVRVRVESRGKSQQALIVEDEGAGFDDENYANAIELFQTSKQFGNGLGLAAVDGFARQSGGELKLFNIDTGAHVELILPVFEDPQSASEKQHQQPVESKQRRTLKVFLLEDNKEIARVIKIFLKGHGHQVIHASSVAEAICKFSIDSEYDIVVADIILSDGYSFTALDHLRTLADELRVVYMTGYGPNEFEPYLKANPGVVLEKPLSLGNLLYTLQSECCAGADSTTLA